MSDFVDAARALLIAAIRDDWTAASDARKNLLLCTVTADPHVQKQLAHEHVLRLLPVDLCGVEAHCVHCGRGAKGHAGSQCLFAPTTFSPCKEIMPPEAIAALHAGQYILAIKEHRAALGSSLKDAKHAIDREVEHHRFSKG